MKTNQIVTALVAVLASTACSGERGNDSVSAAAIEAKAVKPPAGGDWSQMVAATDAGGFVMGNPNAAVKLVELGSLTCSHCANFDKTGFPALVENYVKKGLVSFEFRNFVRDPIDLTASLVTRCNGAGSFFPLTEAMFKQQGELMQRFQAAGAQMQALQSLPPAQQFAEYAKIGGLQQWAAQRGVPSTKLGQCLTNQAEIERLVQMNADATSQYPDFPGTPAFILNGNLVEGSTWELLEPELKKAIGG